MTPGLRSRDYARHPVFTHLRLLWHGLLDGLWRVEACLCGDGVVVVTLHGEDGEVLLSRNTGWVALDQRFSAAWVSLWCGEAAAMADELGLTLDVYSSGAVLQPWAR